MEPLLKDLQFAVWMGAGGQVVGSCAEKQGGCSPLPKQVSSDCCRNSCIPGAVRSPLEQGVGYTMD